MDADQKLKYRDTVVAAVDSCFDNAGSACGLLLVSDATTGMLSMYSIQLTEEGIPHILMDATDIVVNGIPRDNRTLN